MLIDANKFGKILIFLVEIMLIITFSIPIIVAIYTHTNTPDVPNFEQFKTDYILKRGNKNFQWIPLEQMPPAVSLYSELYKTNTHPVHYVLDILQCTYLSPKERFPASHDVTRQLKELYQLPINLSSSSRWDTDAHKQGCIFKMGLEFQWGEKRIIECLSQHRAFWPPGLWSKCSQSLLL